MLANGLRLSTLRLYLLLFAVSLWADPKEQGVRNAGPSGLQAGVARVVTLSSGVSLHAVVLFDFWSRVFSAYSP